ncbi:MAG TPA: helix-turn-helix transcriptional regulator, partial [Streptomyces sp.]
MTVDGTARARTKVRDSAAASSHPLAYVRRNHGWSYQDLARVIADHARALGVPMAARREKVWRWEHWGVVPEADSQRALARALGIPAAELESRPWPRWLPAHGGMPDCLPWTVEGSRVALKAVLDNGATDPRGFPIADEQALRDVITEWHAAATGSLSSPAGDAADSPVPGAAECAEGFWDHDVSDAMGGGSRPFAPDGTPGAEGDAVIAWLEAGVLGLRRLDDRFGGGAVR